MWSSSLTTLPPTSEVPTLSSEPSPPRQAPKRTYGRAKHVSPPPDKAELPSVTSISEHGEPSSARDNTLVNRWTDLSMNWRSQLAEIDAPCDDVGLAEDPEELAREMARLRGELRGKISSTSTLVAEGHDDVPQMTAKVTGSLAVSVNGSSQASPFSLPPSSPPKRHSSQASSALSEPHSLLQVSEASEKTEEESYVIKRPSKGKTRNIVASDEEDEETPKRRAGSKSSQSASPPLFSSQEELTEQTPTAKDTDSDGEKNNGASQNISAFLTQDDEEEAKRQREQERTQGQDFLQAREDPLAELDDLFSYDKALDERDKSKNKGLNKRDKEKMYRDIDAAKRLKGSSPPSHRLTIEEASPAPRPLLIPSSENDPISLFTPSSAVHVHVPSTQIKASTISSSPTPSSIPRPSHDSFKSRISQSSRVPGTSEPNEQEEEDKNEDFRAFTQREEMKELVAEKQEEKMNNLKVMKAKLAREAALRNKPKSKADDDDDLDIVEDSHDFLVEGRGLANGNVKPSIKTLDNIRAAAPRRSTTPFEKGGPKAQSKSLKATETYIHHAAHTPNHASSKFLNGGVRPAGQKKGRDAAVSQAKLDAYILDKHRQQANKTKRKKEERWGRGRILPQRVTQDVDELVAQVEQADGKGDEDEDEDEEDGEYTPDDENEEQELMNRGEEVGDEEAEEPQKKDEPIVDSFGEKGNRSQPETEEDEDLALILKRKNRKPRASTWILGSDDEDESMPAKAPTQREPLAEAVISNLAPLADDIDVDLAGFDECGMSQLFDATQVEDAGDGEDAFAELRNQKPVGLIPTQLELPPLQISESQALRDDQLVIAAIEDAAMMRAREMEEPAKRYLNTQGLFTQTKPATPEEDYDPSYAFGSDSPTPLTQRDTQYARSMGQTSPRRNDPMNPSDQFSPTQRLTRLKRRVSGSPRSPNRSRESSPEANADELEPTQVSEKQRNAFDVLRAGARSATNSFNMPVNEAERKKKNKKKSEFLEAEAEESDEDDGGWMKTIGDEDEHSGDEGDDRFLEGLVDDAAVSEEEKARQDELAAQKRKEIEAEDDAKRLEEARKITEGEHRKKRKGQDFYDDDSDDEGVKLKKLSRKERKRRELGRAEGLLDGEINVFEQEYHRDMDTDQSDVGEEEYHPSVLGGIERLSPEPEPVERLSYGDRRERLQKVAKMNAQRDMETVDQEMDAELGLGVSHHISGHSRATAIHLEFGEDVTMKDSNFNIKRNIRYTKKVEQASVEDGDLVTHSSKQKDGNRLQQFEEYLRNESTYNRGVGSRGGGGGNFSVIRRNGSSSSSSIGGRSGPMPQRSSTMSSSSSGLVGLSKGDKFA
ncbi:hypothetical protein L804_01568 [Cryptococcus deuterogattii 2001/935-1]|nr:hypothetical protein L804_01568 [Cryptococcus deuterogattii 2001/935-1]